MYCTLTEKVGMPELVVFFPPDIVVTSQRPDVVNRNERKIIII